jgi:hypothetical protein
MPKNRQSKTSSRTTQSHSERIAALRRRIHEIYTSSEGPRAHIDELERLSADLSELMAERPEIQEVGHAEQ